MTAQDIVWDLDPLLPEPGDSGVNALLDRADALTEELARARDRVAGFDVDELVQFMQTLAELHDAVGRAGSFAGLHFSADTTDPARGALMQRVEERSTAIATRLLFFELEWAEVPDERVEALLADDRIAFAAHNLRAARRYRPHLLSEPEEVVLAEKTVTGASAWQRLFEEQVSTITVELDGQTVPLEAGLSHLHSPDRAVRAVAAQAVTEGLQPGLRTRAYVLNTLLADKSVDDRLRHYDSWIASRNLSNEASDESVQALVEAVVGRNTIPQRWYALKAKLLGLDRLADYDRLASVADTESEIGWDEASELVLDAYSTRTRRFRASWPTPCNCSSTAVGSTRRRGRVNVPARSARTPSRRTTRTCCSTGRRNGATCSRSPTNSATASTRTSHAGKACSTRARRSPSRKPRRCSVRPSRSGGC